MHFPTAATATTVPTPPPPHQETHKCPYSNCGKYFSKKYNLKAHLRLHTGEQPFECPRPDCRKKFKWRSSLSSHAVWHTRKDANASINGIVGGGKRPRAEPVPSSNKRATTAPTPSLVFAMSSTNPPSRKKRRGEDAALAALNAAMALPGSPVTSDSDKSLDVELFQGAVLPPLSTVSAGKMEDELLVHEGDVNAAILADSDLFGNSTIPGVSAAAGPPLDTRFGPFELDNLHAFCLGTSTASAAINTNTHPENTHNTSSITPTPSATATTTTPTSIGNHV